MHSAKYDIFSSENKDDQGCKPCNSMHEVVQNIVSHPSGLTVNDDHTANDENNDSRPCSNDGDSLRKQGRYVNHYLSGDRVLRAHHVSYVPILEILDRPIRVGFARRRDSPVPVHEVFLSIRCPNMTGLKSRLTRYCQSS
jgi:hypothetical protein